MITVNLVETNGYAEDQMVKIRRAIVLIERVMNSLTFKYAILNFRRNAGKKRSFSFKKDEQTRFKEYSNEKVYSKIMEAKQQVGNVQDGSMDLYLALVPGGDGITIGYGYPQSKEIYTYSEYFNRATDASLANHLVHEWCHKIGFDHAFYTWQDKNRDFSVPYAVGNLVERLAETRAELNSGHQVIFLVEPQTCYVNETSQRAG